MRIIGNYCELCKKTTDWHSERIEIEGRMELMMRCENSPMGCPHYSTLDYLIVMQQKYETKGKDDRKM